MAYKIGDRVATTIDVQPHPVGSLGTITHIHVDGAYGVVLDNDRDQLPAHFTADELKEAS